MLVMYYTELDEYGKCVVFSTDIDFFIKHKSIWVLSKTHLINSKHSAKLRQDKTKWINDGGIEWLAPISTYPEIVNIFNEIVEEGKIND